MDTVVVGVTRVRPRHRKQLCLRTGRDQGFAEPRDRVGRSAMCRVEPGDNMQGTQTTVIQVGTSVLREVLSRPIEVSNSFKRRLTFLLVENSGLPKAPTNTTMSILRILARHQPSHHPAQTAVGHFAVPNLPGCETQLQSMPLGRPNRAPECRKQ
jgi:hypothetical protein